MQIQKSSQTLLGLNWIYSASYDGSYQETGTDNNGTLRTEVLKYPSGGSQQTILRSYNYDGANRLSSYGEPGKSQSYGYDAFGNMWQSGAATGVPDLRANGPSWYVMSDGSVNNRLAQTDYDNAGYQRQLSLSYGGTNAVYDAEGRLAQVSFGGVVATYDYDAEGRRVKRTDSAGVAAYYVYDASGQLMAEYGGVSTGSGTQYLATDHLGSTRMVMDAQGNCAVRMDYAPYGAVVTRTGQDCYGTPWSSGRMFTGKERDAETGLDYFGARYLSSAQGRFTSPDEPFIDQNAEDPQSWNLYSYVRNNPLIFNDPTGNDCVYVTSSGTGIDSINNQNTSKECGKTGGYWVDGTVTQARFAHESLILTGTTNGQARTSASYGLGPDPGLEALQRGALMAEPGVRLAGEGLMLFGYAVNAPAMALAECAAKGNDCSPASVAMAMIPGSGGGKTGRKVGERAYEAAKESVDLLRRVLKRLESTPNKTPATKDAIEIVKGRLKDALERLRKSEPHGISGQGRVDKGTLYVLYDYS